MRSRSRSRKYFLRSQSRSRSRFFFFLVSSLSTFVHFVFSYFSFYVLSYSPYFFLYWFCSCNLKKLFLQIIYHLFLHCELCIMIISLTKYLINFLHIILIFMKFFYNLLFFSWLHSCAKNVLIHIVRSKEHSHMTSANMGRGRGLSKVDVTQLSNLKVIRISLKENWKKINMNHQIEESTILSIFSYC